MGLLAESRSVIISPRSTHLDRQKRKKVDKQKAAQNRALPPCLSANNLQINLLTVRPQKHPSSAIQPDVAAA